MSEERNCGLASFCPGPESSYHIFPPRRDQLSPDWGSLAKLGAHRSHEPNIPRRSFEEVSSTHRLTSPGFMLVEAQIVSRMALLFGTTWVVNSIVISGLLCLIVAANLLYQRFPGVPLRWAYTGLFLSLLVSF